jgi:hypothetical protein
MTMAQRVADIYLADESARAEKGPLAKNSSNVPVTNLKQYVGTYWSEKTGALRKFLLRDDKLIMVAAGMTYDLLPLGGGQFEALEADIEHKDRYMFHAVKDGSNFQLEALEGGVPVSYEAVKGPVLEPSHLVDYAGSYANDELRATWTLVVQNGKLVRQQWTTEDEEVEPAFPDGFVGDISEGQFLMHFNRDRSGRVTSFDVATDMVRPMRFFKVADHLQK